MCAVSVIQTEQSTQLVKPSDVFTIRTNGHGVFALSVRPDRLEEATEAMFILMSQNPFKGKSEIMLDVLIEMARQIQETPDGGNFLRRDDDE